MRYFTLIALAVGCNNEKINIVAGTYTFSANCTDHHHVGTLCDDNSLADDPTPEINIELNEASYTVSTSNGVLVAGDYTISPEENWKIGCTSGLSSIRLATIELDSAIDFGDIFDPAVQFENPVISPGCTVSGPAGEEYPDKIYLFEQSTDTNDGPCPPTGDCLMFE